MLLQDSRPALPLKRHLRAGVETARALPRHARAGAAAARVAGGRLRAAAVDAEPRLESRYERTFRAGEAASSLERQLAPLAGRLRRQRTIHQLPRALFIAGLVAFTFTILARVFGLPGLVYLALPFGALGGILAVLAVARQPIGPFETARRVDASLGLRERIATALELTDQSTNGPLVERQVTDALATLGQVNPGAAFPVFARGSLSRRAGTRNGAWGLATLAGALLLALWPSGSVLPGQAQRDSLAMADPNRREDEAQPRIQPQTDPQAGDAVRALSERPEDAGQTQGLLGQPPAQQNGQQNGQQGDQNAAQAQQAQQNASQQNPNAGDRQQALSDLGSALRQSQTGRAAGESLRSGDTQRASQQMNQMAEQARDLSPGERQSLAQAFQQASQQIGDKDRALSDAARRAGEALSQFRNQEAQQAIRDAANQVRQTGEQLQQQRELENRQQQMQNGGQPQLPSSQQQGQQGQQGQTGQNGQQAGQQRSSGPRSEGGQPGSGFQLSELESELRNGGLSGGMSGAGEGGGTGAGQERSGPATRLATQGQTLTVDAEVREGPSNWRPPSPNTAPAQPASQAPLPGGPASTSAVGAGADINAVPPDLADPVRQYFTPETPRP